MHPSLTGGRLVSATPPTLLSRRCFVACLAGLPVCAVFADNRPAAGRKLDFQIGEGFGDASAANIRGVLQSAAESIWSRCPNTQWEVPGFFVYHSRTVPITEHQHRPDGRIAIGLTPKGMLWDQITYQFAHEFCHALAGHANDWQKCWRGRRTAHHWLEESLCETASLFALRTMGKSWAEKAPYPNWKSYAPLLAKYAQRRLDEATVGLPKDASFGNWFKEHEESIRKAATLRDKNLIVARQLLPLFEANPAGWEAVTFINTTANRDPEKTLIRHFSDWEAAAPVQQRKFIAEVRGLFV